MTLLDDRTKLHKCTIKAQLCTIHWKPA